MIVRQGWFSSLIARRLVGIQTPWRLRLKAIYYLVGAGIFCLFLGPPEFNCRFSFTPVFQWRCVIYRCLNAFVLSSRHLGFIVISLLLWLNNWLVRKTSLGPNKYMFEPQWKWGWGLGACKVYLNPPVIFYWLFQVGAFALVPSCLMFVVLVIISTIMYVSPFSCIWIL